MREFIDELEHRIARLENGMGRTASQKIQYQCISSTRYWGVQNGKYKSFFLGAGEGGIGVLHAEFGDFVMIEDEREGLFMVVRANKVRITNI